MNEARMTTNCRQCTLPIDREKLVAELERVPETAQRAAANSVFCSVHCALENFGGTPPEKEE
jgi:hypothetical protein